MVCHAAFEHDRVRPGNPKAETCFVRVRLLVHFILTNGIVNVMTNETVRIDKAGRVVLPKALREQFNLMPGDKLRLSVEGNSFRVEPTAAGGELIKKGSVLVFACRFAEPITTAQVIELIGQQREGRILAEGRKFRK